MTTYSGAVTESMERHLPVIVLEVAVLLQDVLAAESDMRRFVAVHSANLRKGIVRGGCNTVRSSGKRTVVFPGLSW